MKYGLIGAAGYVSEKHLTAISEVGGDLVAAVDPHDCVGKLDSFFPDCRFFTEIERFDRYLEKQRRIPDEEKIEYISVCTPNYLHDAHCRLALRVGAHAICEKPLVISPWNLDALEELEVEYGRKIYNVLQLRLVPSILELKRQLDVSTSGEKIDVCLSYITRRGRWYDASWKGDQAKSGGVALNIGIHFFDLLLWLFGDVEAMQVNLKQDRKMAGCLELERARVKWFLSTDESDLPEHVVKNGGFAHRSMTCDGEEIEFKGFTNLHTDVYREILAGRGTGISDARPAIELVHSINLSETDGRLRDVHPSVHVTSNFKFDRRYRKSA